MNAISRGFLTSNNSGRRFYCSRNNLRSTLIHLQNSWKEKRLDSIESVSKRIDNIQYNLPTKLQDSLKKGFEVLEKTSPTHYVFWHGASRKELLLRILFTELFYRMHSHEPLENEVLLRHPLLFGEEGRSLDWFKQNLTGGGKVTDDHYQLEIISLDCTLNHQLGESAIGKLANPTRLRYASYDRSVNVIAHEVFKSLGQNFIQDFTNLNASVYSEDFLESDLYVMCIPKAKFPEIGYISKPFGVHYKFENEKEKIEACLNDVTPYWDGAPQIRVLAKKTIPYDPEIATLVFPGMSDDEFRNLALKVKNLVDRYFEKLS